MSITKSYNRHNHTVYAYDTTYEWDESRQKKVQHRRCIGKVDPETGEIVPNQKRGHPAGTPRAKKSPAEQDNEQILREVAADVVCFGERYDELAGKVSDLCLKIAELNALYHRMLEEASSASLRLNSPASELPGEGDPDGAPEE